MPDQNKNGPHVSNKMETYTQLPQYVVTRDVLLLNDMIGQSGYQQRANENCCQHVKRSCRNFNLLEFIYNLIPVIKWLPEYSIKKYLPGDVTAGITVAVMHIPQGMAYGLLAGVTPSSGLYMAFFPTLVYFMFGTSRHISVGTLSVISLMTLKVVQTYSHIPSSVEAKSNEIATHNFTTVFTDEDTNFTPMQVVTATAFMCGIHQILMSFLRLGSLASLLSDPLINAFTTGAAIHVTVSQLKDLFGIQIPRHKGAFKIIYTVKDCILQIPNSNYYTVGISLSVIFFMIFMNEIVKPNSAKLCRFPVPAELIAVVGGTLISFLLNFGPTYNVHLVGTIPLGLPLPEFPPPRLLWLVTVDSIAIAIVSYTVTISMALIFAKKRNYDVRANQELLAMGLSNVVGGMFSCVPNATSLSRSLIQDQTGGKTQIASVVSAFLILIILLWIGPFFEVLPRCVLSGIILVALKGMYTQAAELGRYHREGKLESLTWIITFGAVVLVDVDIGLFLGICVSLIALYIKGWKSQSAVLGNLPDTDIYVNLATHKRAAEVSNVKIFQYIGAFNFASCGTFKRTLYKKINFADYTSRKEQLDPKNLDDSDVLKRLQPYALIIDLSAVTHIDVAACKTLSEIQTDMVLYNTILYLTSPNDRVFEAIKHAEHLSIGEFMVLPSIHDAILYFKGNPNSSV